MDDNMQNLSRDLITAKNKVVSLEREVDLGELERLKLGEKLQKSLRKCEELEETVTRLLEEKQKSDDREERAVNRCENISAENLRMSSEFHNSISEFNKMIKQLKNNNVENERLAGLFQEKYDRCDAMVMKMGKEIEDLRHEKLEALERTEELSRENVENKKTIEELRLKCLESDKVADVYKNRLENLSPRMKKIEKNLAEMMTMKVGDLANFVNNLRELDTNSKDFPDSKGKVDDTSGNAAKIRVIMSSPTSRKGDRNYGRPWARGEDDDSHNTVKISHGSQAGCTSPKPESNGCDNPPGSGASASGMRLKSVARCSTKSTRSPPADARDIIEIIESDDETNLNENAPVPNRVLDSNPSENKMNLVQSPSSKQRSKRKRTGFEDGFFVNSTTKKNRNMCPSGMDTVSIQKKENQTPKPTTTHDRIDCSSSRTCAGDEVGLTCGTQTPVNKFKNDSKDEDVVASEDESFSDSITVASLRNKSTGRKIVFEADMLRAINQDTELCFNAVCALYRQEVIGKKLKGRSNSFKNGGFSPIDSMSGRALAEYLIDGDKELKLRKSMAEVKKERPDAIGQCRKLANIYVEKLHEIYSSGLDPLFSQS